MTESNSNVMTAWREVPGMNKEVSEQAQQFIAEVNMRRAEGVAAGREALAAELVVLNSARGCGISLENARNTLSPQQWKLAQGYFEFNERQIHGLLNFVRRFPKPITDAREAVNSLGDVQMALGLREYSEGHGPQTIHDHNFALEWTKLITMVCARMRKGTERSPIESWTPGYAQQWVAMTEPLLTELNRSFEMAKERAGN